MKLRFLLYIFILSTFIGNACGQLPAAMRTREERFIIGGIGIKIYDMEHDQINPYTPVPNINNDAGEKFIYKNSFEFISRVMPYGEIGIAIGNTRQSISFGLNNNSTTLKYESGSELIYLKQHTIAYQFDYLFMKKNRYYFHIVPSLGCEVANIHNGLQLDIYDENNGADINSYFFNRSNMIALQVKPGLFFNFNNLNICFSTNLNLFSMIYGKFEWKYTWNKPPMASNEENIDKKYNHFLGIDDLISNKCLFYRSGISITYNFKVK